MPYLEKKREKKAKCSTGQRSQTTTVTRAASRNIHAKRKNLAAHPPCSKVIKKAKVEGNDKAQVSFDYANKVEETHYGLYQQALKALEAGAKLKDKPYFVCQGCGNTVAGEAPEKCPICGAPRKYFKRVE